MEINQRLYDLFSQKAEKVRVEYLAVGLGYTGVVTSDGGIGMAYTYFKSKESCTFVHDYFDYENTDAIHLLDQIKSRNAIKRGMALALINALNYETALKSPEAVGNTPMFEKLGISDGTKVAMVGYIGPLAQALRKRNAALEIIDDFRDMGDKNAFFEKLESWAQVVILSASTLMNNTKEKILSHVQPEVKTIMIGPSTPMVADAFVHLPVHFLAGMVPLEKNKVMKAIRFGMGTPGLKIFSRKCFLSIPSPSLSL